MRLLIDDRPHELVIVVDEVLIPTRMHIGDRRILGFRGGEKEVIFHVPPVRDETPFFIDDGKGRVLLDGVLCPESS